MKRSLRRVAVGTIATAAVLTSLVQPALASPNEGGQGGGKPAAEARTMVVGHGFFNADGVNIRTGPGTGYTSIGAGYRGQTITVYCTSTWWHITNEATGVTGWVYWPGEPEPFVLLDYRSPEPPSC